jgi:hypothetical protein
MMNQVFVGARPCRRREVDQKPVLAKVAVDGKRFVAASMDARKGLRGKWSFEPTNATDSGFKGKPQMGALPEDPKNPA